MASDDQCEAAAGCIEEAGCAMPLLLSSTGERTGMGDMPEGSDAAATGKEGSKLLQTEEATD